MNIRKSFPLRERGLKHIVVVEIGHEHSVVPLAGTWIETPFFFIVILVPFVVPLAGTWIETPTDSNKNRWISVVPLAGTWIETYIIALLIVIYSRNGRSPCGNVD